MGDFNEENSNDGGSEKNDKDSNPKNDIANKSNNMNILPYIAIFQKTSPIYTVISFLSILNPTKVTAESIILSNKNKNPTQLQILTATIHPLSSILSSNNSSTTREDEKCDVLHAKLQDLFIPALGRLVCLMGKVIKTVIPVQREHNATATVEASLVPLCCDLSQLEINATRGCEVAKVAFVQSTLPSELNVLCNSNVTKRGGGSISILPLLTDV